MTIIINSVLSSFSFNLSAIFIILVYIILVYIFIYFSKKTVKSTAARMESHFHEFEFVFFLQSHLHVRLPATFAVKAIQLEHLVNDHLL